MNVVSEWGELGPVVTTTRVNRPGFKIPRRKGTRRPS
jgi:hypothetical protein